MISTYPQTDHLYGSQNKFLKYAAAYHDVFSTALQMLLSPDEGSTIFDKLQNRSEEEKLRNQKGALDYQRFLDGDNDGMSELIREFKDGLSLYINSMIRNICEAEELMEETFVELIVKRPKYSGKSSFKTWLYAIGRNITYDYIKKRSKNYSLPIDELYDISDKKNLEASYIQQEQNITLYHALENVNTDYSQALHLVYIEGLSISEAAEIMHKSKKQMENLICRGKKAMRAELEKEGFVYEGL